MRTSVEEKKEREKEARQGMTTRNRTETQKKKRCDAHTDVQRTPRTRRDATLTPRRATHPDATTRAHRHRTHHTEPQTTPSSTPSSQPPCHPTPSQLSPPRPLSDSSIPTHYSLDLSRSPDSKLSPGVVCLAHSPPSPFGLDRLPLNLLFTLSHFLRLWLLSRSFLRLVVPICSDPVLCHHHQDCDSRRYLTPRSVKLTIFYESNIQLAFVSGKPV